MFECSLRRFEVFHWGISEVHLWNPEGISFRVLELQICGQTKANLMLSATRSSHERKINQKQKWVWVWGLELHDSAIGNSSQIILEQMSRLVLTPARFSLSNFSFCNVSRTFEHVWGSLFEKEGTLDRGTCCATGVAIDPSARRPTLASPAIQVAFVVWLKQLQTFNPNLPAF